MARGWLVATKGVGGDADGGFGGTLVVDDLAARGGSSSHSLTPGPAGGFSPDDEQGAGVEPLGLGHALQGSQVGGDQLEAVDLVVGQVVGDPWSIQHHGLGQDVEGPTTDQGTEQGGDRG